MGSFSKAWAGALVSALTALISAASQIDFNAVGSNNIRDLVLTGVGAALAGFAGVYIAPKNTPPPLAPLPPTTPFR